VTMAAGMAASGLKPYVAIYSSFLQRAYDQLMIDVCAQNLPVTLLLDRGGLCGADGATHQGVFDLSYLRQMPGMVVAAPRDVRDLKRLMWLSLEHNGPMAIRYAKDAIDMGPGMQERGPLRVGEWELLAAGEDVMMLVVGRMVEVALQTSIELHGKRIRCGVVDARFIKPMDEAMLREIAQGSALLVTLEDNALAGGFGSAVLEKLAEWGMRREVLTLGVPDRFIAHATVAEQMEELGLTPAAIAQKIIEKRGA
ncbi:MAG: transketolase C-terminal domain-containing protein, partial [Clostridia bacterium]|nr:transketolase C-terminal domain-containing protein [Clostridia bacterium]